MVKGAKSSSAFKLFYDEIVYKSVSSLSYYKIKRNIDNIRKLTMEIRKTPRSDVSFYMTKLNRINKRMKDQINYIYKVNKDVFEYFYLLYKTSVEVCNDKVDEMPLIISCSFYEDYRIDKKNTIIDSIPKFSSLDKKEIRNETKHTLEFEYLLNILEASDNAFIYDKFIAKMRFLGTIKPLYNETYFDFMNRVNKLIDEAKHLINFMERKLKYSDDYDKVKELLLIGYKRKINNWSEDISNLIINYYEDVYKKEQENNEIKNHFNLINDITFDKYREMSEELILEKENLMKSYEDGTFVKLNSTTNSYMTKFKENLINSFFDMRFKNNINKESTLNDFVKRAIELYELAFDLGNQIFERIMFDASHSPKLKRNNDVTSALINKIYDLYNPVYLLGIYAAAKTKFEEILDSMDVSFKDKFVVKLNAKKIEYDYHGPIPTMEYIKLWVCERRKEFILEHCITDLKSRDVLDSYDTRNYDLYVIAEDIDSRELVTLYNEIKDKINNFDFTSLYFFDHVINEDGYEKNLLLKAAQEFIVKLIYKNLKLDVIDRPDKLERYRDICFGYLNEQIIFIDQYNVKENADRLYENFLKARNEFKDHSKWDLFVRSNDLKYR